MFFWIVVFCISLAVLVKGADWFLEGSEYLGKHMGLSPFIIGVFIVGFGTSFPELVSSLFALWQGALDVPVANAVGSNIANILLVGGVLALASKNISLPKGLFRFDVPVFAAATLVLFVVGRDGAITLTESAVLVLLYGFYVLNAAINKPEVEDVRLRGFSAKKTSIHIIGGLGLLLIGAKYFIDSVIALAALFGLSTGVLALVFVALGTSLPELIVSVRAARSGRGDVALGNIFGSNIFNALVVVGVPGIFGTLTVDVHTARVGMFVMLFASVLFIASAAARRFKRWDGIVYITLYVIFIAQLFGVF